MTSFIVRRALQAIPLLFLISVLVFALIHAAPGGPLEMYLANPNVDEFMEVISARGKELDLAEVQVDPQSSCAGKPLAESFGLKQKSHPFRSPRRGARPAPCSSRPSPCRTRAMRPGME